MSKKREWLQLPVAQHWSCHGTGQCCRDHVVEVTEEEKARILSQGWDSDPDMAGVTPVVRAGRNRDGKPRYRLAQRPDGACVFLDPDGLCRIHRKHGFDAKPLACRMYPYLAVPLGEQVRVGLRFSCPSVTMDRGEQIQSQAGEIARLVREVKKGSPRHVQPPELVPGVPVPSWEWLIALLDCAARFFSSPATDIRLQCLRLMAWQGLVLSTAAQDRRAPSDWFDACAIRALQEVRPEALDMPPPGALACCIVRAMAARLARRDRPGERSPWRTAARTWRTVRLGLGRGTIPPMGPFPAVLRQQLQQVRPVPTPEANSVLARYLRIKLWSGQFCGPANFGMSVHEGLLSLLTVLAVAVWLARWHAASRELSELDEASVAAAVQAVDHHFGYDPILAGRAARFRYRWLWSSGELARLIAYGGDRTAPGGILLEQGTGHVPQKARPFAGGQSGE